MNALVLIVDGWHAGFAGPWGCTWLPTPGLNRLASESHVFDQAYLDGVDLASLYCGLWSARREPAEGSLIERAARHGVDTVLLTDDAEVAGHDLSQAFDECRLLGGPLPTRPAVSAADTHLARYFAACLEHVTQLEAPFLAWMHTSSLRMVWDAPLELRNALVDEDEGESLPPQGVDVPSGPLPDNHDPDERLALRRAYAGQVLVLDECLAALREAMAHRAASTLWITSGGRGFPLGEHGWLGLARGAPLHEELVHFPLLARLPGGHELVGRSSALVQPPDIAATLREWFALPPGSHDEAASLLPLVRGQAVAWRESIRLAAEGQRALRTPNWLLLEAPDRAAQLFVKPDDRWERNDVADRCHDVVERLRSG